MIHTSNMTSLVEDERELENDQLWNKMVRAELAASRHQLRMALMKRGMLSSAAVEALHTAYGAH